MVDLIKDIHMFTEKVAFYEISVHIHVLVMVRTCQRNAPKQQPKINLALNISASWALKKLSIIFTFIRHFSQFQSTGFLSSGNNKSHYRPSRLLLSKSKYGSNSSSTLYVSNIWAIHQVQFNIIQVIFA